ncbi:MAG: hypothetical protein HYX92_12360 [Chloroflexi bacterium]|nr:hypothetical protein [Chloroflexota bacterium]
MLDYLFRQAVRRQEGYILLWAIMTALIGTLLVVPVVMLAGQNFRGSARVEDLTRNFYAADAQVHAIAEDMIRGADGKPDPPNTYTPPSVDLGDQVPSVAISVHESQTLATVRPIEYRPGFNPALIQGFQPSGDQQSLTADDNSYYSVTGDGDPPFVIWELTSEIIEFPKVSFGEVRIVAQSNKSSTKLEVFIYNPNDPSHTQGGYNPIPDTTVILEAASTEQMFVVGLASADVTYLNSLATKRLKIKVRATRTGGFRLYVDQVIFSMAGVVSVDKRMVKNEPVVQIGTVQAGSRADLAQDDASYYTVRSGTGNVVQFEVTSDNFVFSNLDTLSVSIVAQSNKGGIILEMYVYNPTDAAHVDGGYDPVPDFATTVPLANTDKAANLNVDPTDISYLNLLFPISMKLKVRATHTSDFQLSVDRLMFTASSNTTPVGAVQQITQQYVDPGLKHPNFATVAAKEGYLLRIYNVRAGLLKVSWAAHAADFSQAKTVIQVFRGLVVDSGVVRSPGRITTKPPSQDNELIEAATRRPGDAYLQTKFVNVDEGLYTIVFFNDAASTIITDPFAATGEKEDTWIYVAAYKDYVVDVAVGGVGLKAVLRQMPGPTEPPFFPWSRIGISWIENRVAIQSWEPYGQ